MRVKNKYNWKFKIKDNRKMQKIHKLLEEHRPQRLKTTHLMF